MGKGILVGASGSTKPKIESYSKEETLSDSTKELYGLKEENVPNDVFENIFTRFDLLKTDKSFVYLTVVDQYNNPVREVYVNGLVDAEGNTCCTDENGMIKAYSESGTVTYSISGYGDIEDISQSYEVGAGDITAATLNVTRRDFVKITTSSSIKFSADVTTIDFSVVGGGGGGYVGSHSGGSGGGGGYCHNYDGIAVSPNVEYNAMIGAGGSGGYYDKGYKTGGNGGSTTFIDDTYTAAGGSAATDNGRSGAGAGNGAGGLGGNSSGGSNDYKNGLPGEDGNTYGYSSFTETVLYGGGGGGGSRPANGCTPGAGGAGYGGSGGAVNSPGSSGGNGYGGGGGGGTGRIYSGSTYHNPGGAGGSGCVAIRIHLTTAA